MTALVPWRPAPAIAAAHAARGYPDLLLEMHHAHLERRARMYRFEAGSPEPHRPPRSGVITTAVCRAFLIPLALVMSSDRHAPVVRARQVAIWLHRQLRPSDSLPGIGRLLERPVANRDAAPTMTPLDHTTVLRAIRRVDWLMARDEAFAARVKWIETLILARTWAGGET